MIVTPSLIQRIDAYFQRKRPRTPTNETLERVETQMVILLIYRNWWTVFADFLKLHKSPLITYRLNNGLQYTLRPGTTDRGIINETWIRRDYSPDGFEINPTDTILDIGGHIGAFTV